MSNFSISSLLRNNKKITRNKYIGCLDELNSGLLSGWISTSQNEQATEEFIVKVDNKIVSEFRPELYRVDLSDAGIASGLAGFQVDIRNELAKKDKVVIEVCLKNKQSELVCKKEFSIGTNNILNDDPTLDVKNYREASKSKIICANRQGVFLEKLACNSEDHPSFVKGSFTRISIIDRFSSPKNVEIVQDVKLLDRHAGEDLELTLAYKSQWYSNVWVRLSDATGKKISLHEIKTDPTWNIWKTIIKIPKGAEFDLSLCKLNLIFPHSQRNYFDISTLALSEGKLDFSSLCEPVIVEKNETKLLNSNGDFSSWKNGIDFSRIVRGQELADNWYIEFAKQQEHNVLATIVTSNETLDSLTAKKIQYGLRIATNGCQGYCRLISSLDYLSLSIGKNYEIALKVRASGIKPSTKIKRVSLLAKSTSSDGFLLDLARNLIVSKKIKEIKFKLFEKDIMTIKEHMAAYSSLFLSIDLDESSDLAVYNFEIKEVNKSISSVVQSNESILCLEDDAILSQIKFIKGIETWGESKIISANVVGSTIHQEQDKSVSIKIDRPFEGFPSIDVIIPVYNACEDAVNCIKSVIQETTVPCVIRVIDDCSDLTTQQALEAIQINQPNVHVYRNEKNIGYTKSVNVGLSKSNSDWVVILNSDTIVSKGWLEGLYECAISDDRVGMVGPLSNAASWQSVPYIHDKNGDWHLNPLPEKYSVNDFSALVEKCSEKQFPQTKVINGFCQFINKKMLEEIGYLDEVAFPQGYGEENDMCARAVKAGYKLAVADHVYVFHAKSKSFGHNTRKKLSKAGSEALKKKHPDVDWGGITKEFREIESINSLRSSLIKVLAEKK